MMTSGVEVLALSALEMEELATSGTWSSQHLGLRVCYRGRNNDE